MIRSVFSQKKNSDPCQDEPDPQPCLEGLDDSEPGEGGKDELEEEADLIEGGGGVQLRQAQAHQHVPGLQVS